MKAIIKAFVLLVLLMAMVGCVTPVRTVPDLSNLPWKEITINLESGEVLTFCAVYARVSIDIFNNITDIVLYNKEGNYIGAVYDNVNSFSVDPTNKECQ